MKYVVQKFRGGQKMLAETFNQIVIRLQAVLNNISNDNFSENAKIGTDKFSTAPMVMTDVNAKGGASKVPEFNSDNGLNFTCVAPNTSVNIPAFGTNQFIRFNLGDVKKLEFVFNDGGSEKVGAYATPAGWFE